MNRADRRKYSREMKRDHMASCCPICKKLTRHISIPVGKNLCNIVCEGCGAVAKQNVEGVVPMVYDKVIVGAFTHVIWDGEERTLELKDGRKKVRVKECDYQLSEDCFAEKEHIGTYIEYLAIDDFVVIDNREENCGEMKGAMI